MSVRNANATCISRMFVSALCVLVPLDFITCPLSKKFSRLRLNGVIMEHCLASTFYCGTPQSKYRLYFEIDEAKLKLVGIFWRFWWFSARKNSSLPSSTWTCRMLFKLTIRCSCESQWYRIVTMRQLVTCWFLAVCCETSSFRKNPSITH